MILTVTPNPAIDKTYVVDRFDARGLNKSRLTLTTAGGKGVNVARVCAILGCQAVATGFLGGHNGDFITTELERCGILPDFVRVVDETRTCVEILDPSQGVQAKVNEAGPPVTASDAAHLEAKIGGWLGRADLVVLSGSGSPGTPANLYARIIKRSRESGVRVLLDSSGEMLRQGIAASPFLVKPNAEELSEIAGVPIRTPEEAGTAARVLLQSGIAMVAVSLGAQGVVIAHGTALLHAEPPPVELLSSVGSGDCMVAGIAGPLRRGGPRPGRARGAGAAGTANAAVLGVGLCTRGEVENLMPLVKVTTLA